MESLASRAGREVWVKSSERPGSNSSASKSLVTGVLSAQFCIFGRPITELRTAACILIDGPLQFKPFVCWKLLSCLASLTAPKDSGFSRSLSG